jgi:glycoside/pentoside/hexuronide:cation symporter, GPH family
MSLQRLGLGVKLAYGVGLAAEGVKNNAFNVFLLFYYQQLVGLDPALCGLALFVSLCADAVLDPIIGAWSDGIRSKLGRRHPFMYASILPLAFAYLAVFMPPQGLGTAGKFLWLLVFSVATRVAMAFFVIPHSSLVPELSPDSGERASLTSLRVVFAWIFGLVNALAAYTVFLKSTPEQPMGLLNAQGYGRYAVFGAVVMVVAMAISALGTQRAAQERISVGSEVHMSLREVPRAMRKALETKSYRAVVSAGLFLFVGFGMAENLNNYMNTFFWGFTSEQIGKFIVVIFFASLTVLGLARYLLTRFGSRKVGMGCALIMGTVAPSAIGLRLAGLMPEMGDPKLFSALCVVAFIQYAGVILSMTVIGKMIADVSDEHELLTGARQEGLLFSANMFLTKAASGLGTLVSGVLIKLAQFPENASVGHVDPNTVTNLGMGTALASIAFGIVTYVLYSRFQLSQERHSEIVRELARRRGAGLRADGPPSGEEQVAAYAQG